MIKFLFLLFTVSLAAQTKDSLTFEKLKVGVHEYLKENDELYKMESALRPNKKVNISVIGAANLIQQGSVLDGLYGFSINTTLAKAYFLIVDGNVYKILDITTRDKLDTSIKELLDFCDKKKYCETIISNYVSRLVGVYYNINKWQGQTRDLNCEEGRGVNSTTGLP